MPTELQELDPAVAERVMGWRVLGLGGFYHLADARGHEIIRLNGLSAQSPDEAWTDCPPFSADTAEGWSAMRLVIERMRELGYSLVLHTPDPANPEWQCDVFMFAGLATQTWQAEGQSGPEAVARASLAALGEKDA